MPHKLPRKKISVREKRRRSRIRARIRRAQETKKKRQITELLQMNQKEKYTNSSTENGNLQLTFEKRLQLEEQIRMKSVMPQFMILKKGAQETSNMKYQMLLSQGVVSSSSLQKIRQKLQQEIQKVVLEPQQQCHSNQQCKLYIVTKDFHLNPQTLSYVCAENSVVVTPVQLVGVSPAEICLPKNCEIHSEVSSPNYVINSNETIAVDQSIANANLIKNTNDNFVITPDVQTNVDNLCDTFITSSAFQKAQGQNSKKSKIVMECNNEASETQQFVHNSNATLYNYPVKQEDIVDNENSTNVSCLLDDTGSSQFNLSIKQEITHDSENSMNISCTTYDRSTERSELHFPIKQEIIDHSEDSMNISCLTDDNENSVSAACFTHDKSLGTSEFVLHIKQENIDDSEYSTHASNFIDGRTTSEFILPFKKRRHR